MSKLKSIGACLECGRQVWQEVVLDAPPIVLPKPKPLPPEPLPVASPYFNFFGQERFLMGASYFDWIHSYLVKDLNYLKSKGIDLIRIYLGFARPGNEPFNFLFLPNGSLAPDKLRRLKNLLKMAVARRMVIDITASRRSWPANTWQMSFEMYKKAWIALALKLKEWGFTNFFFDFENEHRGKWGNSYPLSVGQAKNIRNAVKAILPNIYCGASIAGNRSPENAVDIAKSEMMDLVLYHDPRQASAVFKTEELARRCKKAAGPKMKICLDEPDRIGSHVKTATDFKSMLKGAKKAKIALWVFHSKASFKLRGTTLESRFNVEERKFLNSLN